MDSATIQYNKVFNIPDIRKIKEKDTGELIKQINNNAIPKEIVYNALLSHLKIYVDRMTKIEGQMEYFKDNLTNFYDNNENNVDYKKYLKTFTLDFLKTTPFSSMKRKFEYILKITMSEFHIRMTNIKGSINTISSFLDNTREELFNQILKK